MAQRFEFTVSTEQSGRRLDQVIAAEVERLSRTLTRRVVAAGGVFVDKKRVKVAGRLLHTGQRVVVHFNEQLHASPISVAPPEIPIVALSTGHVVVDKPSGMFSAPTPESDRNDLTFALAAQLKKEGLDDELFVVHRLDRPTSGLMVLARTRSEAAVLSEKMESHTIHRDYLALVLSPTSDAASIDTPIDGRTAKTHFTVLEQRGPVSLIQAKLETGRMHQVRIHAEAWGSPILGDSKYGRSLLRARLREQNIHLNSIPRLALHACRLAWETSEGVPVTYQSPLPADLLEFWNQPLKG